MNRPSIVAIVAAAVLTTFPPHLQAQAPPAADPSHPAFEVASIKRNVSGSDNASVRAQPGGRVAVTNNSLRNIIRNAYGVQNFQIVGGPDWINSDRWDIVAKAEGDTPPPQMLLMVRTLLAERFKLVVHIEMRDTPVFALVIARSDGQLGPQLRRSTVDCATLIAAAQARKEAPPNTINGRPSCGTRITAGTMMTTATTMADVARNLSPIAGRSVVDKTGLTGGFDLDLSWAPEPQPSADAAARPASDLPSLFTAVQEQLGLKLDSQRAPIETLVIDSAERPTED
jgi:uncharacterized protein (TIGR03435 family)